MVRASFHDRMHHTDTPPGVTTKDDIKLVHNMVLGYMKNPRSLLLAVVAANVDTATQEILEMADEVDKDKFRTMGILTKPDLVDEGARMLSLRCSRANGSP